MTASIERQRVTGDNVEARSATALVLSVTAVIAAAIGLAAGLGDGQGVVALVAGMVAVVSFVVSMMCFSADAEPSTAD